MKKRISTFVVGMTFIMTTSNVFGMIQGIVTSEGAIAYNAELKEIHKLKEKDTVMLAPVEGNTHIYELIGLENSYFVNADYITVKKVNYTIEMNGVKVRDKAYKEGKLLNTLEIGDTITVLAQSEKWYQVQLENGTKGFVYKDQLECNSLKNVEYKNFNPVEVLHWSEAKNTVPRGTVVTIEDVYTGKTFKVKRTFGTNHADVEALTKSDTAMIKAIWGGFTWERRPVIVHINGRKLAASLAGMPHAGSSLDAVRGNGMNGVIDLHFKGSKRHAEGGIQAVVDPLHQKAIQIAAKYQK